MCASFSVVAWGSRQEGWQSSCLLNFQPVLSSARLRCFLLFWTWCLWYFCIGPARPCLLASCSVLIFRVLFHTESMWFVEALTCAVLKVLTACWAVHLQVRRGGRNERSSLLPCFPVLLSPAQPCSPGCWSASHFHGRGAACVPRSVWKGPLQSAGLQPAPAHGSGLSKAAPNIEVGQEVGGQLPWSFRSTTG